MRVPIGLLVIVLTSLLLVGCGGPTEPATNNAVLPNSNGSNSTPGANVSVLDPIKTPQTGPTNDAPTLGPVVQAYYEALKQKDETAVRKLMATEFLKTTEADMKAEKKTDLIAFLTEYDKLPEGKMQVRNEQIAGDRATVEVKGGIYVEWPKLPLVNEGGSWKLTNQTK